MSAKSFDLERGGLRRAALLTARAMVLLLAALLSHDRAQAAGPDRLAQFKFAEATQGCCLTWSRSGRLLATAAIGSQEVIIYRGPANAEQPRDERRGRTAWQKVKSLTTTWDRVTTLTFTPDETMLAVAYQPLAYALGQVADEPLGRTAVIFWALDSGTQRWRLNVGTQRIEQLVFSPDGATLCTLMPPQEATVGDQSYCEQLVHVWTVRTRQPHRDYPAGFVLLGRGAWDGESLLWGQGAEVRTLPLAALEASSLFTVQDAVQLECLAASPQGVALLSEPSSADQPPQWQLWDTSSGRPLALLPRTQTAAATHATLSPDGRLLAFARPQEDERHWLLCLFDARSGRLLTEFEAHKGAITALAFSPDSRVLASGSIDGAVSLWDAAQVEAATAEAERRRGVIRLY